MTTINDLGNLRLLLNALEINGINVDDDLTQYKVDGMYAYHKYRSNNNEPKNGVQFVQHHDDCRVVQLRLQKWENLERVPTEIEKLSNLTVLDLIQCTSLKQIPKEISNLTNLTRLDLSCCENLRELPNSISNLSNLRMLGLYKCRCLERLPNNMENLTKLIMLVLYKCRSLKELPYGIKDLTKLSQIDERGCTSLTFPPPKYQTSAAEIKEFMKMAYQVYTDPKESGTLLLTNLDLLFAVVQRKDYADAVVKALWAKPELEDVRDEIGRPLMQLACKELQQRFLFYGRYDLEKEPRYESETCELYFAKDMGDEYDEPSKPEPVALKFIREKIHYETEIGARYDNGNERFDSDYVIADIVHYNSADEKFNDERLQRSLPEYCIVLEQGERNLAEAIGAEKIAGDMSRVRPIAEQLGKCIYHVHGQKMIHGDAKPRNFIRETKTKEFQLTDFDAATLFGEPVADKYSSAYMPPEMVMIKGKKAFVRASSTNGIDDDEVLIAHPSFDVWGFGVILYHLVTRISFFDGHGVDTRDNLNSSKDLKSLAKWTDTKTCEIIDNNVHDSLAKDLLKMILKREPNDRPSMKKVLEDDFFDTGKYVARLKQDLGYLKREMEEARNKSNNELVETLTQRIDSVESNITNEVKKGVNKLESHITSENNKLKNDFTKVINESQAKILRGMLSIDSLDVPTLWVLTKRDGNSTIFGRLRGKWSFSDKYELRMLCQLTGKCKHEPIKLKFLKAEAQEALKKAAPLIKTTLLLLKVGVVVGSTVGRLYGIPLPSKLQFLDDIDLTKGKHVKIRDMDAMKSNIDDMITGLEELQSKTEGVTGGGQSSAGGVDSLISTLAEWQEQNKKSGLETCYLLKRLIEVGQYKGDKNYKSSDLPELSGLQKMVHQKGHCIWVEGTQQTKNDAKTKGYIQMKFNQTDN